MTQLTRDELLTKQELAIEKVDMGEGTFVYVKEMTGRDRDRYERSLMTEVKDGDGNTTGYERSLEDFRAKLAVFTTCDETGKLLFKPSDYSVLSQNIGAFRLERIVNKAQELNLISEADKEALIKNSEGGQAASSTSDSAES
ncbi:hypothetical protein GWN42_04995 [candidate division KSB1 bacterium]|nr:hypothetical protein [Phycisphaerae bacterium]NIV92160.1 hypothetical protein [candidate division KSB1 bacterium]